MGSGTLSKTESVTPISDSMRLELDNVIDRIKSDKRGKLEGTVSLDGLEVSLGYKISKGWDTSVWYGREWSGNQDAGARIRYQW